jgi:ACT domain-containing protein
MVLLSKHVAVNQKEKNTMRAVITVIGKDRVGIIAGVSKILADANVNILDITQTIMQGLFTMIMLVEISGSSISFEQLSGNLAAKGDELGLKIRIQHEDIFKSMHEI